MFCCFCCWNRLANSIFDESNLAKFKECKKRTATRTHKCTAYIFIFIFYEEEECGESIEKIHRRIVKAYAQSDSPIAELAYSHTWI